jgi:hypothetical protein
MTGARPPVHIFVFITVLAQIKRICVETRLSSESFQYSFTLILYHFKDVEVATKRR